MKEKLFLKRELKKLRHTASFEETPDEYGKSYFICRDGGDDHKY